MTRDVTAPTRPVLRYPGGKWQIAPWILQYFPPHRCYVEPFMGAASVFVRKPRSYAEVLNDLNGDIVNLFRILRDPSKASSLQALLTLTPYSRQEYEDAYEPAADILEQARRFLIRSWQGFNGEGALGNKNGWRRNSDRRGTLPVHDWQGFPSALPALTNRLQGVMIEQDEALTLLEHYDSPTTLFYIDPPYDTAACPHFNGYSHAVDQTALRFAVTQLQGMVALSGYHSPLYDTLYGDWQCVEYQAYAGTSHGKSRGRTECLWLNAACQGRLIQLSLF
jgi:DNA adenine methylase